MELNQIISKAVEGGYKPFSNMDNCHLSGQVFICIPKLEKSTNISAFIPNGFSQIPLSTILLSPLFWQSLGKQLEWGRHNGFIETMNWKEMWHKFIDHLASGHDIQSFFKEF